jgi:peptidoglycan/xylan/chitin deacetylase (PgdA/CDA1 family)
MVTIDLHDGDEPEDITFTSEWLAAAGLSATFFIHSTMLENRRYVDRLRELPQAGHEVASHTHRHDAAESAALISGSQQQLAFLETSRDLHEDFFGTAAVSFRSPGWCALSAHALDELQRLGYAVDSSATPQRWSVLGSTPFRGAWALSRRDPHYIRPGLIEVPTSTVLVPAGSPAFLIFRRRVSLAFARLLVLEAAMLGDRAIVLQFHPSDFNPASAECAPCGAHLRLEDFILRPQGGFGFKHHLKDTNRARIAATTEALIRILAAHRCCTLADFAASWQRERGMRLASGDR